MLQTLPSLEMIMENNSPPAYSAAGAVNGALTKVIA